jgi:hypothetical protein
MCIFMPKWYCFPLLVRLQQAAELQQRRGVRHALALAAQVDADETPQRRAIEQRVLARGIGQVEPLLHEVHAQHALQAHRRATVARLGVVRLDDCTSSAQGTISSIVARNTSRLVGLRYCS